MHAAPRNRYLFETRRFGPFTTRRIQQIVQGYREMAGITQPLHPHLFRHQMLTPLTSKGLTDAQIALLGVILRLGLVSPPYLTASLAPAKQAGAKLQDCHLFLRVLLEVGVKSHFHVDHPSTPILRESWTQDLRHAE
jgi:hypothetical protein